MNKYQNYNPPTAIDLILEVYEHVPTSRDVLPKIALIRRGNPPFQGLWALPGGFQEMGESLETTAMREGKEETGLDATILEQLPVFSSPKRDPRGHVNSVAFIAYAIGTPKAGDDAADAVLFAIDDIPSNLAFDHNKRIEQYKKWKGL